MFQKRRFGCKTAFLSYFSNLALWSCKTVWANRVSPCWNYTLIKSVRALFSSVGRAGVPCTEALSSLQRSRVWILARVPFAACHPPNLFPVMSLAVLSRKPKKYLKKNKKQKKKQVNNLFTNVHWTGQNVLSPLQRSKCPLVNIWPWDQSCLSHVMENTLNLSRTVNLTQRGETGTHRHPLLNGGAFAQSDSACSAYRLLNSLFWPNTRTAGKLQKHENRVLFASHHYT